MASATKPTKLNLYGFATIIVSTALDIGKCSSLMTEMRLHSELKVVELSEYWNFEVLTKAYSATLLLLTTGLRRLHRLALYNHDIRIDGLQ